MIGLFCKTSPFYLAKLLLTPMKHMVVPPPMSAHAVELPSPASCVSFSPPPCCGDVAVLLSNGRIAIFKSLAENGVKDEFKPPGKPPKLIGTYRYSELEMLVNSKSLELCSHLMPKHGARV